MAYSNSKDLTGMIFGDLLVTGDSGERTRKGEILWSCTCACGNKHKLVKTHKLTKNLTKSCGCRKKHTNLPGTGSLRKELKRRNGKTSASKLSAEAKSRIISDFLDGVTFNELELKYSVDYSSAKQFLKDFRDSINAAWELNIIMKAKEGHLTKPQLDSALATKYIRPELSKLLSPDDSPNLTQEELVYGWVFLKAGSNGIALDESGFTKALSKKHQTEVYKNLLGIYLREKPNVSEYISGLQLKTVKDLEVSKRFVQSELISQVEQLKEICASDSGQRNRGNMLKAIELLGRSVGAFQDNIKIEQVDPGAAIDTLLNAAKEEIDAGSYTIEDTDEN